MDPATVHQLVKAIEVKDLSTAAHTWRVVLYSRAMLEAVRADNATIHAVTQGAALHDVGKIDIPSAILTKPDRLTPEEFAVIQQHPVTGYARMVAMDVEDEHILDLIRFHHERWDGLGYPYGLKESAIPVVARHFAVIDAFDAMTSLRPYRHEVGEQAAARALTELRDGAGTRYDPDAVGLFADLFERGSLTWILNYFNDGTPIPDFTPDQSAIALIGP